MSESILDQAAEIIHGARRAEYGTAAESFGRIAALWSAYLGHEINGHDVCMLMILLKTARAKNGINAHGSPQEDSLVDIGGYAGCSELIGLSRD